MESEALNMEQISKRIGKTNLFYGITSAVIMVFVDAVYFHNQLIKIWDTFGFNLSVFELQNLIYDEDCWNSAARYGGDVQILFNNPSTASDIITVFHVLTVLVIVSNYILMTVEQPTYFYINIWITIHLVVSLWMTWIQRYAIEHLGGGYFECIVGESALQLMMTFALVPEMCNMIQLVWLLVVTFIASLRQN